MRRRFHRHRPDEPELNITAFLNLMVILIPFLLMSAVFSRITVLDLQIPPANETPTETPPPKEVPLTLNIIVRADVIAVATNKEGLIRKFPRTASGFDYKAISELLQNMKDRIPEHKSANLLLEPDISYETVVTTMDTIRLVEVKNGDTRIQAELFPDISLGDAPAKVQ